MRQFYHKEQPGKRIEAFQYEVDPMPLWVEHTFSVNRDGDRLVVDSEFFGAPQKVFAYPGDFIAYLDNQFFVISAPFFINTYKEVSK